MVRSGLLVIVLTLFFLQGTVHAHAQTSTVPSCQPIFGGGEYPCANTDQKATPSPSKKQMTKKTKTTPATGPETIALIGLLPAAAAGFFLRYKSMEKA